MRINDVEAYVLRLPNVTDACDGTQDTALIKITTNDGYIGWGEVDSCPSVVKAIVDAPLSHQLCNGLSNILRGKNAADIDDCMQSMYEGVNYYGRSGVGAHAMAGVNIALWDIKSKASNQPLYQLLGVKEGRKFRAYCSVLFGDTPAATYELARRFADMGFTAIKFGWGPMGKNEKNDIDLVRQAKKGVGDDVDILIDAGQVWDWKTALSRAEQFEEFAPLWIEEPLSPDDIDGYAQLTARSPVPIATGEAESDLREFKRLVLDGGLHWIQPDPGRCGITTFVEAGEYAYKNGCRVVNHSFKSGITIAASLHALATVPDSDLFEYSMSDSPIRQNLTNEAFKLVDGYIGLPDTPGLGVTIDEDTFRKYLVH